MDEFRSITPQLWNNPEFRKLSDRQQKLFIFLFSRFCDHEGRFSVDLGDILDGGWSREQPVVAEDVRADLQVLVKQAKFVLLYGPGKRFGFLTGWFEHQVIEKKYRKVSTLPPPPVDLYSWDVADLMKSVFVAVRKKDPRGCDWREGVRWARALPGGIPRVLSLLQSGDLESTASELRVHSQSTASDKARQGRSGPLRAVQSKAVSGPDARAREAAPAVDNSPQPAGGGAESAISAFGGEGTENGGNGSIDPQELLQALHTIQGMQVLPAYQGVGVDVLIARAAAKAGGWSETKKAAVREAVET